MPGIDGHELAVKVLERRPGLAIVFVSDSCRFDTIPGAVFLPKPFSLTDLLRAVVQAIEQRRARAASAIPESIPQSTVIA